MFGEIIHRSGTTVVRRLRLDPGEATPWHRDPFHRVTVVVSGGALRIEFRDGSAAHDIEVAAGQVDSDAPCAQVHRAINTGKQSYEEVTIFFLDRPDAVLQPEE